MQGVANGWGDDTGGWEDKPDASRLADLNLNQNRTTSDDPTGVVFCHTCTSLADWGGGSGCWKR